MPRFLVPAALTVPASPSRLAVALAAVFSAEVSAADAVLYVVYVPRTVRNVRPS